MTTPDITPSSLSILATGLRQRYGAILDSKDLADVLRTSPDAIRQASRRGVNLLPSAPLPGRGKHWVATDVAAWIAARSVHGRDFNAPGSVAPRKRGRPRKYHPPSEVFAQ